MNGARAPAEIAIMTFPGGDRRRLPERRRAGGGNRPDQQAVSLFVRQILDGSSAPAVAVDVHGHVLQSNVAGLRLLGTADLRPDLTALVGNDDRAGMIAALAGGGRWSGNVVTLPGVAPEGVLSMTVSGFGDAALDGFAAIAIFDDKRAPSVSRPALVTQPSAEDVADSGWRDGLQAALNGDEFVVHYQPIIELAGKTPVGVEALVRWNHPSRGLIGPADFIDAAERLGLIGRLGEVVLEKACTQLASWRREGRDLYLAVNVSALQLVDPCFPRRVQAIMMRTGIEAQDLWLEITETALIEDVAQATLALRAIEALGVKIAIDDFGTGWGSLTYLREFPVHALKIDRAFVDGLEGGVRKRAIVRSVIQMGHELALDVIAEGIETCDQQAALEAMGCTTGQGFLFSRPVPADDVFAVESLAARLSASSPPPPPAHDHGVHLYGSDDELVRSVADSFQAALAAGGATLLVATAAHRRAIEADLAARGVDLDRHDHLALDAHVTLEALLVDGVPDPGRFAEIVASVVAGLCATRSGVTIYGELVGLLWDRGEVLAALLIEDLWNELGNRLSFALSCGYRNGGEQRLLALEDVCAVHSYVVGWSPLAAAGAV